MCNHCNIKYCSILNKSECPINKLWESETKHIDNLLTKQYGIKLDNLYKALDGDGSQLCEYWN
jgi:hypothetical protein